MSVINKSYIYSGTIRHRRFTPFNHFFTYPLFMTYIDLNSIEDTLKKSWLWNINKPAMISFMRNDYHGDHQISLDEKYFQKKNLKELYLLYTFHNQLLKKDR